MCAAVLCCCLASVYGKSAVRRPSRGSAAVWRPSRGSAAV